MTVYDCRFKTSSTITISGPSQSGKTTLIEKIVSKKKELFTNPIETVYWLCAFIPKERLDGVNYVEGLSPDMLNQIEPNSLVIIDDLMKEAQNSDVVTRLMTKDVHHKPITLIYVTHNIFPKGNDSKTRRLNAHYLIVFKNPHDSSQIDILGRQMYPKVKNFLSSVYSVVTAQRPYSYLLIDSHQTTPDEIRIRTNVTEPIQNVFIPWSMPFMETNGMMQQYLSKRD